MHIQTKTDSKTLGNSLNVNKGFLRTKGRKEKKKGRGQMRWEKPTFLRALSRSKELYSPRPLSRGTATLQNPEKSLQTGSRFCPLQGGDEQLGLQEQVTLRKNGGCFMQQEAQASADQGACPGLCADLQDMFSILLLKSLHPQS